MININSIINKYKESFTLMIEVPEESYLESSLDIIKGFTDRGYAGVCLSFLRPYENFIQLLEQSDINTKNLIVIDAATSIVSKTKRKNENCIYISKALETEEIIRALYTSMSRFEKKDVLLFIDSINVLSLYKPLSEIMQFTEFLTRELKHSEIKGVIINIAKGFAQKKFLRDVALKVDEEISI